MMVLLEDSQVRFLLFLFTSNWIFQANRSFIHNDANLLIVVEIVDELIEALSWFHCNKHVMSVGNERYRLKLSSSWDNKGRLGSG